MMNKKERVVKLIEYLEGIFKIRVFLDKDPYKVLVRTILSQRTRDENTDQAKTSVLAFCGVPEILRQGELWASSNFNKILMKFWPKI